MVQFARERDNVLTDDERAKSARKCLSLLVGKDVKSRSLWRAHDITFFNEESEKARSNRYAPSEPTLQWLRDMVGRYVT